MEKFEGGTKHFRSLIVGAGGGGTGPLVYAAQQGLLDSLLDSGLAIIDRQCQMGRGSIGQYVIQSDTAGGTLLECLAFEPAKKVFTGTAQSEVKQAIRTAPQQLGAVAVDRRLHGRVGQRLATLH
ncbi:MAG: hypothetical protein HC853_15635 [Anaerolineae bacterium]|nr:hypothetical protein [Anaerolineae bacterium]